MVTTVNMDLTVRNATQRCVAGRGVGGGGVSAARLGEEHIYRVHT